MVGGDSPQTQTNTWVIVKQCHRGLWGPRAGPLANQPLGIPCLGNGMCQGLEEGGLQTWGWWGSRELE